MCHEGHSLIRNGFRICCTLKNGEVIPCQVSSYDEKVFDFQSPFITKKQIDSQFVKAIEFKPSERLYPNEEQPSELDRWLNEIREVEQKPALGIDSVKLERALTVPRFNRDSPPSHLLVANTGDFKRGKLLTINEQTIQFDSKLRKLTIPIHRVARVVDVSKSQSNRDHHYAGTREQARFGQRYLKTCPNHVGRPFNSHF